jgi:hypothetical protein
MSENDEPPTDGTVAVSRMTAASATDLLRDYRREFKRADADGPYLEELTATIEQLEGTLRE